MRTDTGSATRLRWQDECVSADYAEPPSGWLRIRPVISTLVRLVLAVVFIVAGVIKISDVSLAKLSVQAYQIFPRDIANIIGVFLPVLEIALGLLLLFGVATRYVSAVLGLMLLSFIFGVASLWWRGIEAQCGCFGSSLIAQGEPNYLIELTRDTAMLLGALWLVTWPRTYFSVDGWLAQRAERYLDDAEGEADFTDEQAADERVLTHRTAGGDKT